MHGTGNDFVVLDARKQSLTVTSEVAKRLADRHFGIGCDQLVVLHKSKEADVAMQIFNADGGEISTCGNATRCVADVIMKETKKKKATIETKAGLREAHKADGGIQVNMGLPKFEWKEIPLAESRNTEHLGLQEGLLMDPMAVNMGNPHAIFFVRELKHIRMGEWGPKLEHHVLFPQGVNVSAVQVISKKKVKMVVWERGTGLTMACGSAACAAVVAGSARDLTDREVAVELPGGTLDIAWTEQGVLMTGPVAYVFNGEIEI